MNVQVRRKEGFGGVTTDLGFIAEGELFTMPREEAEAREDWEILEDLPHAAKEAPPSPGEPPAPYRPLAPDGDTDITVKKRSK